MRKHKEKQSGSKGQKQSHGTMQDPGKAGIESIRVTILSLWVLIVLVTAQLHLRADCRQTEMDQRRGITTELTPRHVSYRLSYLHSYLQLAMSL